MRSRLLQLDAECYPLFADAPCGAEWPDGWEAIVRALHDELAEMEPPPRITQVKEKFGGLRVYLVEPHEQAEAAIRRAERAVCDVCAWCGVGTVRRSGCYTDCGECR